MLRTNNTPSVSIPAGLIAFVVAMEVAYLCMRTFILHMPAFYELSMLEGELVRSIPRALILGSILWALSHWRSMPDFTQRPRWSYPVVLMTLVVFGITLLESEHPITGAATIATFWATTVLVAVREELIYRYVIQNWLVQNMSKTCHLLIPVVLTSLAFTLSHLGAQPVATFPSIFVMGVLFGYMYHLSGRSIMLVIGTHFLVDLFYI